MNSWIVIVHEPRASGKTLHGEQLRKYYGYDRIVDGWDGQEPLVDGDMALTNAEPPFNVPGAKVVGIETAKLASS